MSPDNSYQLGFFLKQFVDFPMDETTCQYIFFKIDRSKYSPMIEMDEFGVDVIHIKAWSTDDVDINEYGSTSYMIGENLVKMYMDYEWITL